MKKLTAAPVAALLCLALYALPLVAQASSVYRWYTDPDELRAAVAATGRPVFVFAGREGCSNCNHIYNDKEYLHAEDKEFLAYMEEKEILGFKSDENKFCDNLLTPLRTLFGIVYEDEIFGGGKVGNFAPKMFFAKFKTTGSGSIDIANDVEAVFGATSKLGRGAYTQSNFKKWLNKMMDSDAFQNAFSSSEPEGTTIAVWEGNPDELGTRPGSDGTLLYNGTASVRYVNTAFEKNTKELKFTFSAKSGRRYVFTGMKNYAASNAPDWSALLAHSGYMTATIYKLGKPGAILVQSVGMGFTPLDRGVFFEPAEDGSYVLTLALSAAPSANLPFALKFHSARYTGTPGAIDTPLWAGFEKGKWTMDYHAVLNSGKETPFILLFSGSEWCPFCIPMENLLLDTTGFATATANYPLVLVDNRMRNNSGGPTLLYSPTYQAYIRSALGIPDSIEIATSLIEPKLSANHAFEAQHALSGNTIGYPTLMLCVSDGNGNMRVVVRQSPEDYPVGVDFNQFAQEVVLAMTDLQEDLTEEKDNDKATTTAVFALSSEDDSYPAFIGGLDGEDWRKVTFSAPSNWKFTVAKNGTGSDFDTDAAVTLELRDETGNNLKAGKTGTWDKPPEINYSASAGSTVMIVVKVTGQKRTVPYSLVGDVMSSPYEVAFSSAENCLAGGASSYSVNLAWRSLLEETPGTTATVRLILPEGVTADGGDTVTFGGPSAGQQGVETVQISGLAAPEATTPAEFTIGLEAVENCRLATPSQTLLKVFTLPAFQEYYNGATKEIALVESMPMTPVTLPFLSATNDTTLDASNLPQGITAIIQDGSVVVSGTPLENGSKSATITLARTTGASGVTITLEFTITPLVDKNQFAANTTNYTGRVIRKGNVDYTVGIFTLTRDKAAHKLNATAKIAGVEIPFALPDWTLQDNNGMVASTSADGKVNVTLTSGGKGNGTLKRRSEEFKLEFTPNLTALTADDFAGTFNVSLQQANAGFGFIIAEIAEDGTVTYHGELGDGTVIPEQSVSLAGGGADGAAIIYVHALVGVSSLREFGGMLFVSPGRQGEISVPRVSACTDFYLVAPNAGTGAISVGACGTDFNRGRSITSQLRGTGEYATLDFYAIFENFEDAEVPNGNTALPEGILPQSIPAGITLEEESYDPATGSIFAPKEIDGYTTFLGLFGTGGRLLVSKEGVVTGDFTMLAATDASPVTVNFRGIVIPVPASCCSAGPDAIAYGRFDYNGKSYPARIIPDAPTADFDPVKSLALGLETEGETTRVVADGAADGMLVLFLEESGAVRKTIVKKPGEAASLDLAAADRLSAVTSRFGMMAKPVSAFAYQPVTIEFSSEGSVPGEANASAWLALALPENYRVASGFQPSFVCYEYDARQKVFNKIEDGAVFPETFFAYGEAGTNATIPGGVLVGEATGEGGTTSASTFQFLPYDASMGAATVWFWDASRGRFSTTQPGDSQEGLRHGVWVRKTAE